MSNKENEQPEGDDYLEQLQWQSSFRGRWSSRFTPRWKYKIAYGNKKQTLVDRILSWLVVVLLVAGLFIAITTPISHGEYGLPIVAGSIISLAIVFFLFAVRDAKKVNDDDDEDFE